MTKCICLHLPPFSYTNFFFDALHHITRKIGIGLEIGTMFRSQKYCFCSFFCLKNKKVVLQMRKIGKNEYIMGDNKFGENNGKKYLKKKNKKGKNNEKKDKNGKKEKYKKKKKNIRKKEKKCCGPDTCIQLDLEIFWNKLQFWTALVGSNGQVSNCFFLLIK
ncbi:hypothetical protein RFI_32165 [Reticulomyxa filosa]|uniref:Uncharacterized protein n=1 Tax=Reticulomyxa filosa TaxID=46433 RepID=X6LV27_RETFI|nr:hypothetical protein RFI_32165 [Reticulomyxa filosa]|eukprot:ETO05231.1 hypothetical protein RFI_32165 [Reticulomyxa filosa]